MPWTEESGLFDVGEFDVAKFDLLAYPDLTDSASVSDAKDKTTGKNVTDSSTLSDAITERNIGFNLKDDAYLTESFHIWKEMFVEMHDYAYLTETFNKLVTKDNTESINATDTISKLIELPERMSELLSTTETLIKTAGKNFNESTTALEQFYRSLEKGLQEVSTIIEEFTKTKGIFLNDSVGLLDHKCSFRISGVIKTIQEDFNTVLFDLMNEEATLVKVYEDEEQYEEMPQGCVQCRIMPMSDKDRNLIGMGNFTSGTNVGYFLPYYKLMDGNEYKVEENDIIEDRKNNAKYRVTSIQQEQHLSNEIIYIKAMLRRM